MLEDIEEGHQRSGEEKRRLLSNLIYFLVGVLFGMIVLRTWIIYRYGFVVF